jgi:hypothetical protein
MKEMVKLAAADAFPNAIEIVLQNCTGVARRVTNGTLRLFRLKKALVPILRSRCFFDVG